MFTGIVQGLFPVVSIDQQEGLTHFSVQLPHQFLQDLQVGASVSLDGVCQTVVRIEGQAVWFDAIQETLSRTTFQELEIGRLLNVERAARLGDEIGGHLLSGHIYGRAKIAQVEEKQGTRIMTIECPSAWMKYLFSKGFVALDGASLTVVDVFPAGRFTVHLIPETVRMTTLGRKSAGDWVNLELDSQTQCIVETVERILRKKSD